jgi:putative Mg2+ transporter-C (MgtC) family protein
VRELLHILDPRNSPDMAVFVSQALARLVLAAILGGIIGLERESKHKAAGLRTNMFICFGSAMFTILSERLAGDFGGDHTRIAAQIIPGIGFIGAGSILHSKAGVTGVTTAATIFVVASIGMAAGGGLMLPALFATLLLLVSLHFLGFLETRFNLKPVPMSYDVRGENGDELVNAVNSILEEERRSMQTVQLGRVDSDHRMIFRVDAMKSEHTQIMAKLRQSTAIKRIESMTPEDVE